MSRLHLGTQRHEKRPMGLAQNRIKHKNILPPSSDAHCDKPIDTVTMRPLVKPTAETDAAGYYVPEDIQKNSRRTETFPRAFKKNSRCTETFPRA